MKITLEKLLDWAVETNASQSDIEHELDFNDLDISLLDFLDLLERREKGE